VDDDAEVRESLTSVIEMAGLAIESFSSAEAFLEAYCPERSGCLVLDVKMPGMSGLVLQDTLAAQAMHLPIIFITGYGDVPTSVQAIKAGAVDFLEKPFSSEVLLQRIREALAQDARMRQREAEHAAIKARFARLTPREREVMARIVAGTANHTNKEIAAQLNISYRTIGHHRLRVIEKMQAKSLPDLVRMAIVCGIYEPHQ
jgi:FixJ family two-component response regulator